jgi:exopolyphosphatase / guanosine-5'-triphosphate,3'-diphosphate pyrophosphatase
VEDMKKAAIDIGTNSTRLLIAEIKENEIKEIKRDLIITRLGEGVDQKRSLYMEAIERTSKAIISFKREIENIGGVEKVKLVGTSALRDVNNAEELIEKVRLETGYEIEIVSGIDEARLIYAGISFNLNSKFIIIDIGGGSTEFIWIEVGKVYFKSLNIGAVRMTERYIKRPLFPLVEDEYYKIFQEVNKKLKKEFGNRDYNFQAIGVGGTITTLGAIDQQLEEYDRLKIHMYSLKYEDIIVLLDKLKNMNYKERKKIKGLQTGRADIIIAGTIILKAIMKWFNFKDILISEQDILYGIINDL